MTKDDSNFPLTLRKKGQEVKIYRAHNRARGEDYYTVVFYVGKTRRRINRRTLADAKALAAEKLDQMAKGRVPTSLDPADWELLKELKKVTRFQSPWRFLEDAKSASKLLNGAASLTESAEFWVRRHQHRAAELVSKLYEEYVRYVEREGGERHLRDVRNRVGKFEDVFGSHSIGDVTTEAIREFLERMAVENRTKNNYRAQIITFFRWCRKQGYLEEGRGTVAESVDVWKVIEKEVTIFSVEETKSLFRGIRSDIEAYAAIGAFAGLRPSEIQRLTWGAVDFDGGHIHVSAKVAKKVNRSRYVPLSDNLKEWLLPHRKASAEKVCYFKAPELLSTDAIERKVVKQWPADVLRQSFCSYRLALTTEIGIVSEEAGNSPTIIRKHYRRPVPKKQAESYFSICRGNLDPAK